MTRALLDTMASCPFLWGPLLTIFGGVLVEEDAEDPSNLAFGILTYRLK